MHTVLVFLWKNLHEKLHYSDFKLALYAAIAGMAAGTCVSMMSALVRFLHHLIFHVNAFTGVSGALAIDPIRIFLGPALGGIAVSFSILLHMRWRKRTVIDPIEANALHGGRMSLVDSLILAGHNILSNGVGASVGLEAGYSQIGAGLASRFGQYLQLRRADVRTMVGCGVAGAIAAAFDAPLAGAAYAFELVIGVYTISALAPVAIAAFIGNLAAQSLGHPPFVVAIDVRMISAGDYPLAVILGIICAGAGIGLMQLVTLIEKIMHHSRFPAMLRPVLGGTCVGLLGQFSPQILSAGHGALHILSHISQSWPLLLGIFLLKSLASAVSIGTGFRGGLFFASLFLGGVLGKLYALGLNGVGFAPDESLSLFIIIGMSALAAAVIGAPLTMILLALEVTGSETITGIVMLAVSAAALTARTFFGYSFATWRFHLRGETIRSPQDIGWIRSLTVESLMRRDVPLVVQTMVLRAFRLLYPLGAHRHVIATDHDQLYAGLIDVAQAHSVDLDELADVLIMADLAELPHTRLYAEMNAREASMVFETANTDVLAVVASRDHATVIGMVSQAYMMRRYAYELERNRREALGED
jgi:chloride channel protein, CIC family